MATIAGKYLRKTGKLDDMEISDEINACSIEVTVDVDGEDQQWLLMFKNETHNHPTEIEPFGGASTCIGGLHFVIRCPEEAMYIRQCVSQVPEILQRILKKHFQTSCRRAAYQRGCRRIFLLREPDWSGNYLCKGNLQ